MSNFKIPVIPETTSKTIRFPNDVIAAIEEAIKGQNCTFTAFVVEASRSALRQLYQGNASDGDDSGTSPRSTAPQDSR